MISRKPMPLVATFVGGRNGLWKVTSIKTIAGPPLERVQRLDIVQGLMPNPPPSGGWLLRGVVSHERYTTQREHEKLTARQPELGRAKASMAAMLPIAKSDSWWNLSQDERRRIFETQSHHIKKGLKYLPSIARRLYHSRDLGEPFDFLTWFEYEPSSNVRFDELLAELRQTEEWNYVKREVDIRLALDR